MAIRPYTLFISDLHLQEETPKITQRFLEFLEREATQAEALYILGDFFETWIGDDDYSPYNQMIIKALFKASQQGLKLYLMIGNHDFLLSSGFAHLANVTLINDPSLVELYGRPVLLTHGDALCTLDTQYQKFRHFTHSPWIQALALMAPLSLRRFVGNRLRKHSRQRHARLNPAVVDVTEEAVLTEFTKYKADIMIHGHTHQANIHQHQLSNGSSAQRIVLDAWFEQGNALYWHENGKFELKYF